MKTRSIKFIFSLIFLFTISTSNLSHAYVTTILQGVATAFGDLAPFVAPSAIIQGAAGALLLKYFMTPPVQGSTSMNMQNILRGAKVEWVDMVDNVPVHKSADIPVKVPTSDFVQAVKDNPSKYPNSHQKTRGTDDYDSTHRGYPQEQRSGKTVYVNGKHYYIGPLLDSRSSIYNPGDSPIYVGSGFIVFSVITTQVYPNQNGSFDKYECTEIPEPPVHDMPLSRVVQDMTDSNGYVPDVYKGEIDDFIHSAPNIIPSEPLPNATTPAIASNAAAANAKAAAEAANSAALAAARQQTAAANARKATAVARASATSSAASSAAGALSTASDNLVAAQANAAANPNDPAAQAAVPAAQASKDAAQAASDSAKAADSAAQASAAAASAAADRAATTEAIVDAGKAAAEKAAADKAVADAAAAADAAAINGSNKNINPYGDSSATFDFGGRLNTFITACKQSSLFSLPSQVVNNIPTGGESIYSFNCGSHGMMQVDLANYASALAALRSVLLICFGWVGVTIVTKGGGG